MLDSSEFAYNPEVPLEFTVLSERVENDVVIQDVLYISAQSGKVPGYLIVSLQSKPRAGLIFGHWGEGNRGEFVDEAIILARLGFVSLCLDAPFRRPVAYKPQVAELPQAELQWIVDVRRGADLLLTRFKLSSGSLGYIGHSFSATFGGIITDIEPRIKAYVFMAGWYSFSEIIQTPTYLDIEGAAPAHLFFQFARNDNFVSVEDAESYFELASEPKQIAWYDDCGHELNAQACFERAIFLCKQLGLPQPTQAILDLLKKIPSPVPLGK